MSKDFDCNFYTDDFDQEMMEFISDKYISYRANWSGSDCFLKYNRVNDAFWTSACVEDNWYSYLTKQQFKEKIGMTTKQFTKSDLVAGKHVVELADGSRYLLVNVLDKVVGFNLQCDSKGIHDSWYTHLEEGLVYPYNEDLTVVAVYEVIDIDVYLQCSDRNIKSI